MGTMIQADRTKRVSVSLRTDHYGLVQLDVSAQPRVSRPEVEARVRDIGPALLRGEHLAEYGDGVEAVTRYMTLRKQIVAAEAVVAAAERARQKAAAADVLLKENPPENLAASLRQAAVDLAAAEKAEAAAVADLALIREPVARLFVVAAATVASNASGEMTNLMLSLTPTVAAAREAVNAACRKVEEVLHAALREHLDGPLTELLAAEQADREALAACSQHGDAAVATVLGPVPPGVEKVGRAYTLAARKPADLLSA